MTKRIGTKDEVWAGTAQQTAGKLTREDLMLNAKNKVVSKRQHANGLKQAGSLQTATRTRRMHPDHADGHAAAHFVREQHGAGLIGGLLGGLLVPVLKGISPVLGELAPAIGSVLPF